MKKVFTATCAIACLILFSCSNKSSKNSPPINISEWVDTDISSIDGDIPITVKLPPRAMQSIDSSFGVEVKFSNVYTLTFTKPQHEISMQELMSTTRQNDSLIYKAKVLFQDANGYVFSYRLNDDDSKSPVAVGFKYFLESPREKRTLYQINCDLGLEDMLKVKRGSFSMDSTVQIYEMVKNSARVKAAT